MTGNNQLTGPQPRLLRDHEVALALGISIRLVWKLCAKGDLPQPIRIGRATRWRIDDIDQWVVRRAPGHRRASSADESPRPARRAGRLARGGSR